MVRYETSLSMRESELVILLTGAKFRCEAEFDIHVGEARRVGIGWDVIRSIPRGTLLSEQEEEGSKEGGGSTRSCSESSREEDEFCLERVKECVVPLLEKEHDDDDDNVHPDNGSDELGAYCKSEARERELAIVLFAAELLDRSTVSDETYAATKRALDGRDDVMVEITAIIGYYAYVAYTLNVFRIAPHPSSVVSPPG